MATSQLDRIVKGAPPPNVSAEQVASAARRRSSSASTGSVTAPHAPAPADPTTNLPSSPPQIYLNLLILEASLRAQYLSLRARLRLFSLLLGALALWSLTFTYLLFLRPREDGKGTGGSVYWVVDQGVKVGWFGGTVTWILVWLTGIWDRSIRWPRRWVGITNRGLRNFNLKLVVIRGPMWKEVFGYLVLLDPWRWFGGPRGMRFESVPRDVDKIIGGDKDKAARMWEDGGKDGWIEEDVASGGDVVKLLLLPKPFSPDFREDWDTYRTAYWEKENDRRAALRKLIKARNRQAAKKEGGWLWWTGWRGWSNLRGGAGKRVDVEMSAKTVREKASLGQLKDKKRFKDGSPSISSSRSSTPTPEPDGRPRRMPAESIRRGSSSHGVPRKKKVSGVGASGPDRKPARMASSSSRPGTPTPASTLASSEAPVLNKRASNLSMSSASDSEDKGVTFPSSDVKIKQEPDS